MKKFASFVLALAMAAVCAAPAMAEGADSSASSASSGTTASSNTTTTLDKDNTSGGTTVTFNIEPAYTVKIPQTVTLDKKNGETVTYEKDLTLTASNVRLNQGKKLQVTIASGSTFQLNAGGATLGYTITVDDNPTSIGVGSVVATFETKAADQTATLHIKAGNPTYAGNYSGTLQFTIAVV